MKSDPKKSSVKRDGVGSHSEATGVVGRAARKSAPKTGGAIVNGSAKRSMSDVQSKRSTSDVQSATERATLKAFRMTYERSHPRKTK